MNINSVCFNMIFNYILW